VSNTGDSDATERVQAAFKRAIEVNLARERAITEGPGEAASFHSNGVIFSKSGNGTPFSKGIIFSRTGSPASDVLTSLEGADAIEGLSNLDETTFHAFTERLLKIKAAKQTQPRPTEEH